MALTGIYPTKLVTADIDVMPCVPKQFMPQNWTQPKWLMTWNVLDKSSTTFERRPIGQFR